MTDHHIKSATTSSASNNNQPINFYPLNAEGLQLYDNRDKISEMIQIRANLLKQIESRPAIILVTSDRKKAGVSTVALNIAAILAENPDERILLIDNNLENPALSHGFRVENCPGICNVIEKRSNMKDAIKKTSINNLYFMGTGAYKNSKMSIGRSFIIDSIFEGLHQYFNLIIIDCQPIESNLETLYLAGKAKNVLMVIESENSRQETIQSNKKKLENMGAKVIGAVLNRRRFYIPSWLYKII